MTCYTMFFSLKEIGIEIRIPRVIIITRVPFFVVHVWSIFLDMFQWDNGLDRAADSSGTISWIRMVDGTNHHA